MMLFRTWGCTWESEWVCGLEGVEVVVLDERTLVDVVASPSAWPIEPKA